MIPGSALRRLEAITGLRAEKKDEGCYALYFGHESAFLSFLDDEKEACDDLRKVNWNRVCNLVFERQEWKCARCGQRRPLQGHHVRYRSRWKRSDGPLDVPENVEGLDQECHDQEHRA